MHSRLLVNVSYSHPPHHIIITVMTYVPLTLLMSFSLPVMPSFLLSICFKLCCFWKSFPKSWTQADLTMRRRWKPDLDAEVFWIDSDRERHERIFNITQQTCTEHLPTLRQHQVRGWRYRDEKGQSLPSGKTFNLMEKETYKLTSSNIMEGFEKIQYLGKGRKQTKCQDHLLKTCWNIAHLQKFHFDPTTSSATTSLQIPTPFLIAKL